MHRRPSSSFLHKVYLVFFTNNYKTTQEGFKNTGSVHLKSSSSSDCLLGVPFLQVTHISDQTYISKFNNMMHNYK